MIQYSFIIHQNFEIWFYKLDFLNNLSPKKNPKYLSQVIRIITRTLFFLSILQEKCCLRNCILLIQNAERHSTENKLYCKILNEIAGTILFWSTVRYFLAVKVPLIKNDPIICVPIISAHTLSFYGYYFWFSYLTRTKITPILTVILIYCTI